MAHTELVNILKQKGTGPTMSEPLRLEQLDRLTILLADPNENPVTQATLLTAIRMLGQSDAESAWYGSLAQRYRKLPSALWFLFEAPSTPFLKWTHQVMAHQNLDAKTARKAFDAVLDDAVPATQKAAFLEAERIKRETLDENVACLGACWDKTTHTAVDLPLLIDFAASYDGLNRNSYVSPFAAATLAAMGYPVVLHGTDAIGPKNGQNPYKILVAAGKTPIRPISDLVADLCHPQIGWAYLDQSQFCPALFALKSLRFDMVKRPLLATVEKLVSPVRAKKNALLTSYTHPPYRDMMTQLLITCGHFDDIILVRGVEGGIQFPVDRRCPVTTIRNDVAQDDFVEVPPTLASERVLANYALTASDSVKAGIAALSGEKNMTYKAIVHLVAAALSEFGIQSYGIALQATETHIASGAALAHWKAGMNHA